MKVRIWGKNEEGVVRKYPDDDPFEDELLPNGITPKGNYQFVEYMVLLARVPVPERINITFHLSPDGEEKDKDNE